jgi:hypothetical protein
MPGADNDEKVGLLIDEQIARPYMYCELSWGRVIKTKAVHTRLR